jgi:solute carrier family 9B (sodium/hydrogen exchanger), member 1/2
MGGCCKQLHCHVSPSRFSEMAMINIMLLAGLGLDLIALKKLFGIIMRLSLIPTFLEVGAITVCAHYLLSFPWLWGILLG